MLWRSAELCAVPNGWGADLHAAESLATGGNQEPCIARRTIWILFGSLVPRRKILELFLIEKRVSMQKITGE